MRAQVLAVKEREHVEAAVAAGASAPRTLIAHILPLCWSPILINATMDFGQIVCSSPRSASSGWGHRRDAGMGTK